MRDQAAIDLLRPVFLNHIFSAKLSRGGKYGRSQCVFNFFRKIFGFTTIPGCMTGGLASSTVSHLRDIDSDSLPLARTWEIGTAVQVRAGSSSGLGVSKNVGARLKSPGVQSRDDIPLARGDQPIAHQSQSRVSRGSGLCWGATRRGIAGAGELQFSSFPPNADTP
jgi:hypothetical protein